VRIGSGEPEVVILKTLGAQPVPSRGWRRQRPKEAVADTDEVAPVSICRTTVVASEAFAEATEARDWLERCRRDERAREPEVTWALRTVNRTVRAQRLAAGDPYIHEVSVSKAREVKLGYGTGEELVAGSWSEAYSLPPPRGRRSPRREMLAPQQQVAEILGARKPAYVSEDLYLRACLDLEEGRRREAALQLRIAIEALQGELERDEDEAASALKSRATRSRDLAAAALRGELDERQSSSLASTIEELGRFLRRRRHL
jgi:hypothetical protein